MILFAALDAATGKVIGRCHPRHRGREFLSFLREIERNVPPELEVRLIMDKWHPQDAGDPKVARRATEMA